MFVEHLAQDLTHCKNSVSVGASRVALPGWGFQGGAGASRVALVVRSLSASAEGIRDAVLIPGLGRSPGGEMATHSSILAWRIPWTEKPGTLQSIGPQKAGQD